MKIKKTKADVQKPIEEDFFDLKIIIDSLKKVDKGYWYVALGILIIAGLLFLGFNYAQNSNNFVFKGITFNKTYFGKIQLYTASVPAIDTQGRVVAMTEMDFRSDPRKIADIPVEIGDNLRFLNKKIVYISYQNDLKVCEDNMIAAVNLYTFLTKFGLNASGALDDKNASLTANLTFASCENNPNNTVIHVINSDATKIVEINKNCYEISYKDCEIMKATERFQLELLEEYMTNFR